MEIHNNAWIFQNATTTGNGTSFISGRNDQITLFITGDSSSRTIHFEGSDNDENWFAIPAVKLPELTIVSSTTGNNEVYVINTTNFVSVRCRISAISGGTVKITGRVVDSGVNLLNSVSTLPTGTNIIGKVGIDQTTDGTTNRVVAKISQTEGENVVVASLSGSLANNVTDALPVSMATTLDSDLDSINVDKMGKGSVTTAHSAITATATSNEIDCTGFNGLLIEAAISVAVKNWTFKVQGCMISGGTFVDMYEMANTGTMTLMSYQTNASKGWVFKGIPDYIKIVATEDEDGATVTVKVQPINL